MGICQVQRKPSLTQLISYNTQNMLRCNSKERFYDTEMSYDCICSIYLLYLQYMSIGEIVFHIELWETEK